MTHSAAPADLYADAEELRQLRVLGALQGLETLLEALPPDAELRAADLLALVAVVHDSVRDVLLFLPREAVNDN